MKRLLISLCLAGVALAHGQAINPDVTQANIAATICKSGWTKTVRPPVSYTNRIKVNLLRQQHIPLSRIHDFELDHRVPLELGGAPRDPVNLWLQPWNGPDGAHAKDAVENRMHRSVCAGRVTLKAAQTCMAMNWRRC